MAKEYLHACKNGNLSDVISIVDDQFREQEDFAILTTCHNGAYGIHLAAHYGHLNIVEWFTENHPEYITVVNPAGLTAFAVACQRGHLDIVKRLWSPTSVSIATSFGVYPIELALDAEKIDVVAWILAKEQALPMASVPLNEKPGAALIQLIEIGNMVQNGSLKLTDKQVIHILNSATKERKTYKIIKWFAERCFKCQELFIRKEMFIRNAIAIKNVNLVSLLLSYGAYNPWMEIQSSFQHGFVTSSYRAVLNKLVWHKRLTDQFASAVHYGDIDLARKMMLDPRVNLQPMLIMTTWAPHTCLLHLVLTGHVCSWALPESPMSHGKLSLILRLVDSCIQAMLTLLLINERRYESTDWCVYVNNIITSYIIGSSNHKKYGNKEYRNLITARHAIVNELGRTRNNGV